MPNDTSWAGRWAERWAWRRKTLYLAVPIMLANISVPLVGVVDTAVMGRMADPVYIGATAIGATLFSSIFWLFGFLRMGTGGLVAQATGRNEPAETRATIYRALIIALLIGTLLVCIQGPVFALSRQAFVTSDQLLELTYRYFSIRIYSAPATLMVYALIGALVGLQQMKSVLCIQLMLNLTNITLTLFFFTVMGWGISGVAIASVSSDYIALGTGLYLLNRHIPLSLRAFASRGLFSRQRLQELLAVNGNLFIRTLCLIAAYYWMTATSSRLGEITLAANALLIHMLHLMAHGLDGFAHAAESLCGQAFGRKDRHQFMLTVRTCAEWGLVFAAGFGIVFLLFGVDILRAMTSMDVVVEVAATYLPWIIIAPLMSVWSFLLDGIYAGVTHTRDMRNGMLISLLFFAFASVVLTNLFGNHGFWAAYIALMLARTATLGLWYPRILCKFNT